MYTTHKITKIVSFTFLVALMINVKVINAQEELAVFVVDWHKGETVAKRLSREELFEISQYGIDLFTNLETFIA